MSLGELVYYVCNTFSANMQQILLETIWIIKKAFRDDSMKEALIKFWYASFKLVKEAVESDPQYANKQNIWNVEYMWISIKRKSMIDNATIKRSGDSVDCPKSI